MLTLKILAVFIILNGINYIVSVKNNPYYRASKDFVASSREFISIKMN